MRSAIYWLAWNAAVYLAAWVGHCFLHNLAGWPVKILPAVLLFQAAVNLALFAGSRPLGEDCDRRK